MFVPGWNPMNRKITNVIRWIMDEMLPPLIRDNYFFMYPFFFYWFKGNNIDLYMKFKSLASDMTNAQIREVYRNLACRANDRPTDLSEECLEYIIDKLATDSSSLLDVGCGRGYFLQRIKERLDDSVNKFGIDLVRKPNSSSAFEYINADLQSIPLADRSIDIVTCSHTLEHLRDLRGTISEIKRVARNQVIIVVPRQRYYYYTLDLHLHFFPEAHDLTTLIGLEDFSCMEIKGDWVYIGYI